MNNWTRMMYQPCAPLGKDGKRITGCDEHIALSRKASADGIVLLKNTGILPLKKDSRVAVFGKAQYDYIKCGGGSGTVYCKYTRNIYEGMKLKADEGKISLYSGLYGFYKDNVEAQYATWQYSELAKTGLTNEPLLTDDQIKAAREQADIAIITICRYSKEGYDRESVKGDFYLSEEEEKMVADVCKYFDNVIAVLNVGSVIDSNWFKENDKISAAMIVWNGGMEGGAAVGDIICGDITPSGKLVDTFAKSFDDYPSSENFHDSDDYKKYYDDIYVGYRYFETIPGAAGKVNYPFGFGLSYTTFSVSGITAAEKDGIISVSATVKNTGDLSGREVIQVYVGAPGGKLGRPAKELKAFKKTKLLSPGDEETLSLSFKVSSMATFDDTGFFAKSAYILEKGDYVIYVGTSVRDTVAADYKYSVAEDFVVTKQLTSLVSPAKLEKRLRNDGTYESLPVGRNYMFDYKPLSKNEAVAPEETATLADVADKKVTMAEFLAQLSNDELIDLLGGKPSTGLANTSGMCGTRNNKYGIPCPMTADGPAGVRLSEVTETATTAWPCATMLACTWDTEIVEQIGRAGALEMKENNLSIWLTPALNIHRTPLCGRNFEYFSEDPLIAGKMAAAKVRGIQSEKIAASAKHFACNNYETKRLCADTIVSERALREIYLKGFEICVKEASPWTIMTAYNKINGHHASEHYELITGILRGEWGFDGMVTTDWGCQGFHPLETKAGNDIKMPNGYSESFKEMTICHISREELEACVGRILEMIIKLR